MSEAKFFVPGPTWVRPEILEEMTADCRAILVEWGKRAAE